MVSIINLTHFLIVFKYSDKEVTKVVNIKKANLKPSSSKLVRFGKKIGKWSLPNENFQGIKYFNNSWGKRYYKYQSPYQYEYNKSGEIADEIVIYAKPGKVTSYIFYDKQQQKLYYGITDSSFTFHPDEVIHIYSEELLSLSDAPKRLAMLFVYDNMVNQFRNLFREDRFDDSYNLMKIPPLDISFKNYLFSSVLDLKDVERENLELYGYWLSKLSFPFTGIRKKTLIRDWTRYRNAIPAPQRDNNPNVVHRVMEDGYLSDEEPLDVRRDRLRRNAAIERAIESMNYTPNELSLRNIPEPDEHGYITFNDPPRSANYDINYPERMFEHFEEGDTGDVLYYYINGEMNLFRPSTDNEVRLDPNKYGFYWCPTDNSFGIRCKKEAPERTSSSRENNNENNTDHERAHMVNKYIYLKVLNDWPEEEMVPQTVDFYTKSYYYLGRLKYDEVDIRRKAQVSIPNSELKSSWNERSSSSNN